MYNDPTNSLIFEKYLENLNEDVDDKVFPVKSIYNFYFLYTLSQLDNSISRDRYKNYLYEEYASKYKGIWLKYFKKVVYDQLYKYMKMGRVDSDFGGDFESINSYSISDLANMMKKTYRSDMSRRNEKWIMLADYLEELENENNVDQVYYLIDRINNVVHNTGEVMLTKFSNSSELIRALEKAHNVNYVRGFLPHISRELRRLL